MIQQEVINAKSCMTNNISVFICVHLWIIFLCFSTNAQTKLTSKVLLIPLDDRPPCLQFPVKMGLIGDVEVVTPPRNLLGRFTEFGKSDEIIKWIKTQNLKSFDAAIVSLDMLAYGGLVAMREYETTESAAMKRADFIREIRKLSPKMPIYGSSVIMRLAPTGNVVNESYRNNLSKWAEISADESKRAETAELEKKIPAEALEKYKKARQRDLKLNLYAVELVQDKVIDYLILSQDDAKPNGVHIADREKLISYVKSNNLGEKVAIQPGADEVSMLLLARTMTDKYKYRPKIKAIYSDEKIADQIMPYEDRPLRKTVSFHIKATGAEEVPDYQSTDIRFLVFASRFTPNGAENFIKGESADYAAGGKISFPIVADIDVKGDVQGGDVDFTERALKRGWISPAAVGYAAWNTAGNTIGTALPQGVIHWAFIDYLTNDKKKNPLEKGKTLMRATDAKNWFIIHRLVDDFYYHSVVRPKALKIIRDKKWNSLRLTKDQTAEIEAFCLKELNAEIYDLMDKFLSGLNKRNCKIYGLKFDLPWNRTFEAEIDFQINCQ
jgi:hypothetical protein